MPCVSCWLNLSSGLIFCIGFDLTELESIANSQQIMHNKTCAIYTFDKRVDHVCGIQVFYG